jgi:hypothetical protein
MPTASNISGGFPLLLSLNLAEVKTSAAATPLPLFLYGINRTNFVACTGKTLSLRLHTEYFKILATDTQSIIIE